MRKLTIILGVAALAATSSGCCGRCRNFFHKGSPCGTTMTTPALLSAPLAMGAPLAGPVMQPNQCCEQAPQVMCVPCDPCMQYDPCANGQAVSSGYFGGFLPQSASSDCGCENGGVSTVPTTLPAGATIVPSPTAP
jgi:hypothetical protein